jgi:nucleotide-binding universal stress UspA family protein
MPRALEYGGCRIFSQRTSPMIKISRILVPTDFSELANLAVDYGSAIAEQFQSELHLLHVVDDYFALAPEAQLMLPDRNEYLRDLKAASEKELAKRPVHCKSSTGLSRHTIVGRPFTEIVRFSKDHKIDLIVIGSHGRRGLSHFLLGSVAERVVRTAGCPVLTVRPDQHQFVTV